LDCRWCQWCGWCRYIKIRLYARIIRKSRSGGIKDVYVGELEERKELEFCGLEIYLLRSIYEDPVD